MNFSDEHYVRLYTRDTKTWMRLGFEGQVVLMFLLRKLDKAGVLDDIEILIDDVALVTGIPVGIVNIGLPRLLSSGVLEHRGSHLVMPRYLEAQTASKSDALRAKESRERQRAKALSASRNVTERHEMNADVTACDEPLKRVTRHEITEPRDEPSRNVTTESQNEAKRHEADRPRHPTQSNAEQRNARETRAPFRMHHEWDPGPEVLMGSSVPTERHAELLDEFRAYWCQREDERPEHRWRAAYAGRAVQQHNDWVSRGRPERKKPRDPNAPPAPIEVSASEAAAWR